MLIQSKWQISIGAVRLLNLGDYIKAEPMVPRMVQNAVAHPLRAPSAIPLRSYNAEYVLKVDRVQLFPTDDLAWEALLAWLNYLPIGPALPGCITTASGLIFNLANCLIQPGATAQTESNKLHTRFSLLFSQITLQKRILTGSGAVLATGAGQPMNA